MPFGALLWEFNSLGWVLDVAFSPSGCRLAWVAHDSSLTIMDKTDPNSDQPVILKTNFLPFTALHWASESTIIAVVSFKIIKFLRFCRDTIVVQFCINLKIDSLN